MQKNNWFLFLILTSLLVSCYDEKRGCVDPEATNFDVSADKDCCADLKEEEECCCEYPSLVFRANFKKDDSTGFSFFDGYATDAITKKVYLVKSIDFYLNGIEVEAEDGTWRNPKGASEKWLYNVNGKEEVSDNVLLVKSGSNSQTGFVFAPFSQSGLYTGVKMNMGLTAQQNAVIPDSLKENHPLGFQPDSLWIAPNQFIQQRWIVVTDTAEATFTIDTFQVLESIGELDMDYSPSHIIGKGGNLDVTIDILVPKWLEGVDWSADRGIILQKLSKNSVSAISLVQ